MCCVCVQCCLSDVCDACSCSVLHVACGRRLVSLVGQLLTDKHVTVANVLTLDDKGSLQLLAMVAPMF